MQFYSGKIQKILHPSMTILAIAEFDEEIPKDFGIWDLKQFLSAISLFKDPDISLDEQNVIIKEDKQLVKYRTNDLNVLNVKVLPRDKNILLEDIVESFEISKDLMNRILNSAALFKVDNIVFIADGETLKVRTMSDDEVSSTTIDAYSAEFEIAESKKKFKMVVKASNMNIISDDYTIEVDASKKLQMKSKSMKLRYILPCEKRSEFEG